MSLDSPVRFLTSLPSSLRPSSFHPLSSVVPHPESPSTPTYLTTLSVGSVGWIVVYFAAGSGNSSGGGGGGNALTHVGSSDGRSDTPRVRRTRRRRRRRWRKPFGSADTRAHVGRTKGKEREREVKFGRGSFTLITRIKVWRGKRGRGRRIERRLGFSALFGPLVSPNELCVCHRDIDQINLFFRCRSFICSLFKQARRPTATYRARHSLPFCGHFLLCDYPLVP